MKSKREQKIYCKNCGAETYNAKDCLCDFCWEMDVRLRFASKHNHEAARKIILTYFPELTDLKVIGHD
ncbi:hypothetical protein C2E25_16885 [Geothermobacter hydrogeniphilus]|uniref:Uncharacterized protein n=1 Tax=Geothermobacter hydrogeniphilus TaxID=1969733 RepID=A0A2K2H5I2_9BACT|nr:hypothetical protein [Geothermobacter hydrogeniphilus]PNU18582.1 hypothetical protein C2E25_16885 [Geothermobacter hydrogeniphilus]